MSACSTASSAEICRPRSSAPGPSPGGSRCGRLPKVTLGSFVGQPQQHIAVAGQGRTPADEIAPAQLGQSIHQARLLPQPPFVCGNGSLMVIRAFRTKRVRPLARRQSIPGIPAPDVDGAGWDNRLSLLEAWQMPDVEDLRHRLRLAQRGG
jgi:hypothetical protein